MKKSPSPLKKRYAEVKDFHKEYKEKGAYHLKASGFQDWWLTDNYKGLASRVKPDDVVLDLACGEGRLSDFLTCKTLIGSDYSARALELNRRAYPGRYANLLLGDMRRSEEIAVALRSVDIVLCSVSLMYLTPDDLTRCLKTIRGWLKPGGRLSFTYPTVSNRRTGNPNAFELPWKKLRTRVERASFTIDEIAPICPLYPGWLLEASKVPYNEAWVKYLYMFGKEVSLDLNDSYHFIVHCSLKRK